MRNFLRRSMVAAALPLAVSGGAILMEDGVAHANDGEQCGTTGVYCVNETWKDDDVLWMRGTGAGFYYADVNVSFRAYAAGVQIFATTKTHPATTAPDRDQFIPDCDPEVPYQTIIVFQSIYDHYHDWNEA